MKGDTKEQADWLCEKIAGLRLFDGKDGTINDQSILDIQGSVLVISQFTLAGDTAKGRRPDYTAAAPAAEAKELYEYFLECLGKTGISNIEKGRFGAHMIVSLVNDGPVTLMLER